MAHLRARCARYLLSFLAAFLVRGVQLSLTNLLMDSTNSPTTQPLFRGTQLVWYVLGLIEVLLAFRLALKMLEANPSAGFTTFIYGVTYIFTAPFLNVFHITNIAGSIFEWPTLLAMFVYAVIAYGI